jgi:hypothetical protein
MFKKVKKYTIKYSKAGFYQYADFFENEDGIINDPSFYPQYVKPDEVPSLDNVNTIDEILSIIKKFSFSGQAEIYLIDEQPVMFANATNIQEGIKKIGDEVNDFINGKIKEFFIETILPLLNENKFKISTSWIGRPILIYKNEDGEWDNIEAYSDINIFIEYVCYQFLNKIRFNTDKINFKNEVGRVSMDYFARLIHNLDYNELKEIGIFIDIK